MTRRWLLAEDDDVDAMAVARALSELGADVEVERVTDGEAALARLTGAGAAFSLAVLDLNLPRMSGLEILSALGGAGVPAVVLSTSSEERGECLRLGAVGVFMKAADHGEFLKAVQGILDIESTGGCHG